MSESRRLIVTSALPYVNNVPHLGNVVGCVLPADIYTRYMRDVKGREVLFIAGVDEYGTATEMKARELGITCKELCDRNYDIHKEGYDWFKIDPDCYGRTSQPNGDPSSPDLEWAHTTITRDIYNRLVEVGAVIEQEEVVWYCDEIEAFVADRYILSECYHCGNERADGDQCDQCGQLLSTDRLVNPRYKPNPSYALTRKTTSNLYLDLPSIWSSKNMDAWFESNREGWSESASSITTNWVDKKGLKPRSITRDLKWGTRVPDTEKFGTAYSSKVFYVWFDAPIGYLSIMENQIGRTEALRWWNKDAELVQFMAKDNVPFHSIIFPATLAPLDSFDSGDTYGLPQKVRIASSDYLMYEGQKFSKSKNTGLFCDDVIRISAELKIDADLFRLYLTYVRPETGDSNFVTNENGMVDFHNSILINNLGNMCHRIRSILFQYGKKHQKTLTQYDATSEEVPEVDLIIGFHKDVQRSQTAFEEQMKAIRLRDALKTLFEVSSRCNQLVNEVKPWEYTKRETTDIPPLFYEFMVSTYLTIRWIGQNIAPFAPGIGQQILTDFPLPDTDVITLPVPESKPKPMFTPLEPIDLAAVLPENFGE
jgi:methionyl-tRNA synthetase